jgi:acyl-CoA thioesterase FadM
VNLATGIVKVLATQAREPRLARIDDEIAMRFRVWPVDIDYMRHMNNARYFTAMDLVRISLTIRSGLARLGAKRRWSYGNAAQKAVFFRGLRLWQPYVVSGRLLYADDRWLYVKQHVRHEGDLRAIGLFKIGIREGRDVVSPREVVAMLGYEAPAREAPPEVVEWESVNAILVAEKKAEDAGLAL